MTAKQKIREIKITPQMFISPPYIKCPHCSKKEFGVIHISRQSYSRRCRACLKSSSYKLPSIKKKIIYLDQMAISEMMKSLNPNIDKKRKERVKPIWEKLFMKLDRLVKLQLIICPDSTLHYYESLVIPDYFKALKRMYEQLSNSVSFYDEETIKRFQINRNFRKWMGEKELDDIDIYSITGSGEIDGWQDRLRISVEWGKTNYDLINDIKKHRDQVDEQMKRVFKKWQSEKGKSFIDWYEKEMSAFGPMIFRQYLENTFSDNPVQLMSATNALVAEINRLLVEHNLSDEEVLKKTLQYFKSDQIKDVPYIKISSALFASIARKVAGGQKSPPTMGDANDIKAIASLAPYCDAMFIDKKMHSFLDEGVKGQPVRNFVGLKTKFFSQKSVTEFLNYLQEIENSASKSHLKKVEEVYGENWENPFVEMYDH